MEAENIVERPFTLTEKLIGTAENINEIRTAISQIKRTIDGPEISSKTCCDPGPDPWPPELNLHAWANDNKIQTSCILEDLLDILRVI